jgi:hypothetical protein
MEPASLQSIIDYLENNQNEFAEVMLDNGIIYTTRYMKLMEDIVYVTTDHMEGKDVAVIPAACINHIVIKNSGIERVMGFNKGKS